MSSGDSDIELPSALPKKSNKKMPKSPTEDLLQKTREKQDSPKNNIDPKKLTTKMMIHEALIELKSRKGVSLYAIKKYLTDKYNVDTEKMNYLIKKNIKRAVEEGTIVQLRGIGASGSFKLVPVKEKKKKTKPKKIKVDKEGTEKSKSSDKPKKIKEKSKKVMEKTVKSKNKNKENKSEDKPTKLKKKPMPKEKMTKDKNIGEEKGKKMKAKFGQTPAKTKASMMKRKSIGSIIKPPKMKPKAKA